MMDLVTITRLNYSIHGKLVEYDGNNAGIASVRMIIDMGSNDFPGGFDINTAEEGATARVMVESVECPKRGDKITTVYGSTFVVDSYKLLDGDGEQIEWQMQLRECNG